MCKESVGHASTANQTCLGFQCFIVAGSQLRLSWRKTSGHGWIQASPLCCAAATEITLFSVLQSTTQMQPASTRTALTRCAGCPAAASYQMPSQLAPQPHCKQGLLTSRVKECASWGKRERNVFTGHAAGHEAAVGGWGSQGSRRQQHQGGGDAATCHQPAWGAGAVVVARHRGGGWEWLMRGAYWVLLLSSLLVVVDDGILLL